MVVKCEGNSHACKKSCTHSLEGARDKRNGTRYNAHPGVPSIVALAPNRRTFLASIALDSDVQEPARYWALLLLILFEQRRDREYCTRIAEKVAPSFTGDDHQECARGLLETMRTPGHFV